MAKSLSDNIGLQRGMQGEFRTLMSTVEHLAATVLALQLRVERLEQGRDDT